MKKYTMLGVNSHSGYCCKLSCLVPFSQIDAAEVEANDFKHDATNWSGCDEINRTLGFLKMKQTGNKILLQQPITFSGVDHDHGHVYAWRFNVDEIHELEEI